MRRRVELIRHVRGKLQLSTTVLCPMSVVWQCLSSCEQHTSLPCSVEGRTYRREVPVYLSECCGDDS